MSEIYNYIEDLCKNHGISVTKMCQETGVSRAALTDLKKGRSLYLTPKTIYRISSFFDIDANEMIAMQGTEFLCCPDGSAKTGVRKVMDVLLNDVSKLAAQYGEDSPITVNAIRIGEQKQKVIDKLNHYCKVPYDDNDKIDALEATLVNLVDVVDAYFRLDANAQEKLAERIEELKLLQKKSK